MILENIWKIEILLIILAQGVVIMLLILNQFHSLIEKYKSVLFMKFDEWAGVGAGSFLIGSGAAATVSPETSSWAAELHIIGMIVGMLVSAAIFYKKILEIIHLHHDFKKKLENDNTTSKGE